MKHIFIVAAIFSTQLAVGQIYKDKDQPIQKRVDDLLSRMTLQEKIEQLAGDGLRTKPNTRLGIPAFEMSDGPIGVRTGKSTAFPAGITLASSWDTLLMAQVAKAIAVEAKAKGINMMLGPTVNIHRFPIGGRNFESFSEDPYLASRMAVNYVRAMQNENVIACVKHFCCNDQEWERMKYNAVIDDITLNEIHLPAFKAAVQEAGAYSVMSAYNKINGKYASENSYLLTEVLKRRWNFDGFVVSDWEATHSTVPSVKAGLDLEMPTPVYFGDSISIALKAGKITEAEISDKVRRQLLIKFKAGLFDNKIEKDESKVNSSAHQALALEAAVKGTILLKNDKDILPLTKEKIKKVAIIGPNANIARTGAGGSSLVNSHYAVTPLEAMQNRMGKENILFSQGDVIDIKGLTIIDTKYLLNEKGEPGLSGSYWDKAGLEDALAYQTTQTPSLVRNDAKVDFVFNDPESPSQNIDKDYWIARWTGSLKPPISRKYKIYTQTDDGIRVWFEDKLMIDNWNVHGSTIDSFEVDMEGFKTYKIRIEYFEGNMGAMMKLGWDLPQDGAKAGGANLIADAVEKAKQADVAILFVGMSSQYESEGFDTKTGLKLPSSQNELIEAVAKVNPNTIVCLTNGNAVEMPWLKNVAAVLEGWYGGQEVGNAFAKIIFGEYNPSAKLATTYVKNETNSPTFKNYKNPNLEVAYDEKQAVGYRYYAKNNVDVQFPFGYGLSFTKFEYKDLKITPSGKNFIAEFTLKNTGKYDGEEVSQLYITSSKGKELKGFAKTSLKAGEEKKVQIFINPERDLTNYDMRTGALFPQKGEMLVEISQNVMETKLKGKISIK